MARNDELADGLSTGGVPLYHMKQHRAETSMELSAVGVWIHIVDHRERIAALERQVSSEWRCKEVYRKDVERLEAENERLREGMVRLAEEWDYLEPKTANVARFRAFADGEKP